MASERMSYETQFIQQTEDLARNMTDGKQTDLILLDSSKAFDQVSHLNSCINCKFRGVQGKTFGRIIPF